MVKNEDSWPNWPFLPMKKRTKSFPDCGLLVANRGATIYKANLFELSGKSVDFDSLDKTSYVSFEALLQDGWEVD